MKNMYTIIILVITVSFLLIPLLATKNEKNDSDSAINKTSSVSDNINNDINEYATLTEIKLYLNDEKKTLTLSSEEYIVGVVAAEMSAENNPEAIKAQALAAYTYAYRKHIQNKESNNDYDLTNDSTLDQGYLNKDSRKEKWGDNFSEFENKIIQNVKSVKNQLIVYKGEPILAAYHAISAGKTETAKNVWGTDYPYLQSENSVGDLLCPEFYSQVTVSKDNFIKKLTELGAKCETDATTYIGESKKSEAGTVLNIELCGKSFTGTQIREAFELKSAAFDIAFKDDNFIFSVSGYGHGVGMSQFGANYMAQQGSDYKEIISAYYKGAEIVDIK